MGFTMEQPPPPWSRPADFGLLSPPHWSACFTFRGPAWQDLFSRSALISRTCDEVSNFWRGFPSTLDAPCPPFSSPSYLVT